MENTKDELENSKETPENVDETTEETTDSEDTVESLKQQRDKVLEKNRQLFERLKTKEAKLAELESKKETLEEKEQSTKAEARDAEAPGIDIDKRLTEVEERAELRFQGYSRDEISEIVAYAKMHNLSLSEAKEKPFVKKAIEGLRAEAKADETTPAPSNRAFTVKGKTWKDMTREERKSNFERFSQSIKGSKQYQ